MNRKKAIFILCGGLMFAVMVAISWKWFIYLYENIQLSFDWKITKENMYYGLLMFLWLYGTIILCIATYPLAPFFLFGTIHLLGKRKALMIDNPEMLQTKGREKEKNIMIVCLAVLTGIVLAVGIDRLSSDVRTILVFQLQDVPLLDSPLISCIIGDFILFLTCLLCAIFGPLFFYYRSQIKVKREKTPEEVAELNEA